MDNTISRADLDLMWPVEGSKQDSSSARSEKALKVIMGTALAFGALAVIALVLDITLGNQISQWAKSAYEQASQFTRETVSKASVLADRAITWIKDSTHFNFSVPNWTWVAAGGGLLAIAAIPATIGIRKAIYYHKLAKFNRQQSELINRIRSGNGKVINV